VSIKTLIFKLCLSVSWFFELYFNMLVASVQEISYSIYKQLEMVLLDITFWLKVVHCLTWQ
jgi:hypothetical protein